MCDSARAGKSWSDVAKHAYMAYAASTGNKNFRGETMPEYMDLPRPIQIAWEAASRHIGDCLADPNPNTWPDENHWSRWIPR